MIKSILNIPKTVYKFLINVANELKKVEWLNLKETIQLSTLVVAVIIFLAIFLTIADRLLNAGVGELLNYIT
jgi:preprotein translocase SecE subunit